ncbi:hypothetical protein B0H13DRAFT_2026280 [Mycena leptocephala]|nr:hypothetical protein B0H13DRAFT_2026280 [Mycena leptocephala]
MTTIDDNQTAPSYATNQINRDELAGAKLWAVYISKAEKYDKALLEGWKSDMQGLLIFAGLFSASLTAFIIESYKTLTPASFTPSRASLACNTLWFLSLGLSLSCALIATLVDQWTRDFIQRTEMRPSPVIRAQIFSYLYFGFQRFGMHTMVEFIPLLLHMSLLLFFAGLVAFLLPINTALTIVVAALLGLISATYISLTALPMLFSDSPYRTPLSNVAWGFLQRVSSPFRAKSRSDEELKFADDRSSGSAKNIPNMVDRMVHDALTESPKRDERDGQAIVWTIRSLTDNNDLEPFVDAIPDLIRGPTGRRRVYDHMFNRLINDRNVQLVPRIEGLLRSGVDNRFDIHRCTPCIRALWSIAYFLASNGSFPRSYHIRPLLDTYSISAASLIEWLSFCSLSALAGDAISALGTTLSNHDHRFICAGIYRIGDILIKLVALDPGDTASWIQQCRDALNSFIDGIAYDTLIGYMRSSATWQVLQPSERPIGPVVRTKLTKALAIRPLAANTVSHIDIMTGQESFDVKAGRAVVLYVSQRGPVCSFPGIGCFRRKHSHCVYAAPRFFISPCVIAMLKSCILRAIDEHATDKLPVLMDRLQLSNHASGIGPSGDANFLILVDFLEHLYASATSDGWKSIRAIDTFRFLLGHCPRESVPRVLQHRFAPGFSTQSTAHSSTPIGAWSSLSLTGLYDSFSSEQIGSLDKFSATLWVAHGWDRSSDIVPSAGSVSSQASRRNRRHNGTATTPDHVVRQKIALLTVVLRSPPRTVLAARTGGEGPLKLDGVGASSGRSSYTPSIAAEESESEPT